MEPHDWSSVQTVSSESPFFPLNRDDPSVLEAKKQKHFEEMVSEALNDLGPPLEAQNPVDRCSLVVKKIDQVLGLSYLRENEEKRAFVYQKMLPLYCEALERCIKDISEAADQMVGRRYVRCLLDLLKYTHLLKKDYPKLYKDTVDCAANLLDSELEYLEARVYYQDRRGADWSVPALRRILLDRNPSCCVKLLKSRDVSCFQGRLSYVQAAIKKDLPIDQPEWWEAVDRTLQSASVEKAEKTIFSMKEPHPFYKRYLSDVLMGQVLEVERGFESMEQRPLAQNVALLEALNRFTLAFPKSSQCFSSLNSCLIKFIGHVARTVLTDCQLKETADQYLTAERMEIFKQLAENHWLTPENQALLANVSGSVSAPESGTALTDLEVKTSLREFSRLIATRSTANKGFLLIKELEARKAEIARLPTSDQLFRELEGAHKVIYAAHFKNLFQVHTQVFKSSEHSRNMYWERCKELRRMKLECIQCHPFTFVLDERHRTKWEQLVCKSFGVEMTYLSTAYMIDQEYEDKLVVLKTLAPTLPCSNTRIKVKAGLIHILEIAMGKPGGLRMSPEKIDDFCDWFEQELTPAHSATDAEKEKDERLRKLVGDWRQLTPTRRRQVRSDKSMKHWSGFLLFQSMGLDKPAVKQQPKAQKSSPPLPDLIASHQSVEQASRVSQLSESVVDRPLTCEEPVVSQSSKPSNNEADNEAALKPGLSAKPIASSSSPSSVMNDPAIVHAVKHKAQAAENIPARRGAQVPAQVPAPVMVPVYPLPIYCPIFPVSIARVDLLQSGLTGIREAIAQWSDNPPDCAQRKVIPAETEAALQKGLIQVAQFLQGVASPMTYPGAIPQIMQKLTSPHEADNIAGLFNHLIAYHSSYANMAVATDLVALRDYLLNIRGRLGLP